MRLLTIGDSFTYGQELSDSTKSWPNILSKLLHCDLINLAAPGRGNTRMVRKCIEHANQYDVAIVAWSHYARMEFADEFGTYDAWPGVITAYYHNNLSFRKENAKYITLHHNDRYLYRQYLNNIILLQSYFKSAGKKYLMLDTFDNHQSIERKQNDDLIKQIDTGCFLGWPNESMMEWTADCPVGPRRHFLEEGHQRVADKIYEHIRHFNWFS